MRTSGILILSIAGFGFALWLARSGDPPKAAPPNAPAASVTDARASTVSAPFLPRVVQRAPAGEVAAAPAVPKLNPKSEAYKRRMDDQIPTHLYSEASHCYKGGLQRDQRIDLTYRIRIVNGDVTVGDVQVSESTLGDPQLERCILGKIDGAHWRDEQLPDVQEEGDLFMRVAGFSAYLANADDDDSPSSAMN